ncbi:MAG: DUF104 domain-containing protein [Defluviitaleaceae bacterium]|nr:DUF104 domain-containing protein [Defluviitaleaceae bacterium]
MYAVKAIYDGNHFKLKEPIPINEKYEVIITFINPIEKQQDEILQFFNTWDEDDANCIKEIINERSNFSMGRAQA